jgi:DNA-binding beta-propeller fold protein YncE
MTTATRRSAALGLLALTAAPARAQAARRLYFLTGSKVMTCALDGSDLRALATGQPGGFNDGIAYDAVTRRLYWTNMGRASADDGYIQSIGLDGSGRTMVAPPGSAFTPKQLKIDPVARKLYWSDREGMRVMRANLDGSAIEVLVQAGEGEADRRDRARWCVGVAVDPVRRHVYWSQKGGGDAGQGSIRRAGLDLPAGQTPATRRDVEVLFSGLPEPIDLELDPKRPVLYWTDRGDNTVSTAALDPPDGADPAGRTDRKILVRGLREAIGVAIDHAAGRMFYTSLGGEVGTARLDGSDAHLILTGQGPLTGITIAP